MSQNLPTVCVHCGHGIVHRLDKPGKVNECSDCGSKTDVERVGGNMIWEGKQSPYIEIKSLSAARAFAAKGRRFGAGVTMSLVENKLQPGEKEATGAGSGAAPGSDYRSRLGESRTVKNRSAQ